MPTTLAALSQDWLTLSAPYRPSAFWFWNADMQPDRMRDVVAEMAANDIREFLIHPVHGLEIEYLSDLFFERYRLALQLAQEYGLKAWVYDEFGWPSGNVGGKLLREHPECKGWYLHFERDTDGNIVITPRQSDRIMDNVMGSPWTRNERGYIDTLSPDAMRQFITLTHERIYRECGDLFQQTILGFFTDEPVIMMDACNGQAGGWSTTGMPWTPTLPARFSEQFGYDIEPRYAEMVGDGPSQVKRDYWALVKTMHAEAYHGQIGRWCREHGVKYTGHLGEDAPLQQVRYAGSVFQCLRHMDEPGIDFLGAGAQPEDRFVEQTLIPSVARHAGHDRIYCEAYGISPYDLRLGTMLKQVQMFGIHGINDIALMGFHQALDGIRKTLYWPPIFMEAPWWPFYPAYRDATARSIGLTSLGTRTPRYALLYPQNQLEQADLMKPQVWNDADPSTRMLKKIGLAVYAAGETFEFVFPEILAEAQVRDGKIVFPHAEYEALIAPVDVDFFPESEIELARLQAAGADVLWQPSDDLVQLIQQVEPSWASLFTFTSTGKAGDIRIYRYSYADGEVFALHNVTNAPCTATINGTQPLAEWQPVNGQVTSGQRTLCWQLEPHETRYFSISNQAVGSAISASTGSLPLDTQWTVTTERPNMSRLTNMQFFHDGQWLDAVNRPVWGDMTSSRQPNGIPVELRGATDIPLRAAFTCETIPDALGLLFEGGHVKEIAVNGMPLDLIQAAALPVWDASCRLIDIRSYINEGENAVTATLTFQPFETTVYNDAFYRNCPMPSADIFLAGSFRGCAGNVNNDSTDVVELPVNLADAGWAEYDGVLTLQTTVNVDATLAERIRGIAIDTLAEDALEIFLDGKSLGQQIIRPYSIPATVAPGMHTLGIRIASTSASLFGCHNPGAWGVTTVHWLLA